MREAAAEYSVHLSRMHAELNLRNAKNKPCSYPGLCFTGLLLSAVQGTLSCYYTDTACSQVLLHIDSKVSSEVINDEAEASLCCTYLLAQRNENGKSRL